METCIALSWYFLHLSSVYIQGLVQVKHKKQHWWSNVDYHKNKLDSFNVCYKQSKYQGCGEELGRNNGSEWGRFLDDQIDTQYKWRATSLLNPMRNVEFILISLTLVH